MLMRSMKRGKYLDIFYTKNFIIILNGYILYRMISFEIDCQDGKGSPEACNQLILTS